MISECFVYVTLPGETLPVTAGKFALRLQADGEPLGVFTYGRKYLDRADAVAFDPLELKLARKQYETVRLRGVFGALRDAGPDYWGRRVIEKHAQKAALSEPEYLLEAPDDRAGSLGFGLNQVPPAPKRRFNQTVDLEKLQAIADALLADKDAPDGDDIQTAELLLLGTSMGGARPKTVVQDDGALWLAKFNRPDDRWNSARVEHAMLLLARACGLTTAESRVVTVGARDVLLVRRFDRERLRESYTRARMISALTLLRADENERNKWSYVTFAEELRRASGDAKADAHELFRRMTFNALISNNDDHPRNHALLARDQQWRLAPAYDLTPSANVSPDNRSLAMTAGDAGRFANAQNLLSQSERFLLPPAEARALVDRMEEQVKATWYHVARGAGVTEQDCTRIEGAFAYPGFRLPARRGE